METIAIRALPAPRAAILAALLAFAQARSLADEFDRPPISYATATPFNAVETLDRRLADGAATLRRDAASGYLEAVLDALAVPVASQTLVFSKTSLQQAKISPRNPRAIYFNDDLYVGYVRGGDVLEFAVADPALGTVFYTLDQSPSERPRFVRQTDDCLICHSGGQTRGVPGHVLRSVYPDNAGRPIYSAGSHRVDHATPLEHRWGGWYVTGTAADLVHLGNTTYRKTAAGDLPEPATGAATGALADKLAGYPVDSSDLVAHLVLAHQVQAHNVLTQASFSVRQALYREAALNRELGEPAGHRWPSTETVLEAAAKSLVECFLFVGEPPLPGRVGGDSNFAQTFAAAGPADAQGRSLKTLDLETRLLAHPCSHLIHTASFDGLPDELRARFWRQLDAALADQEGGSLPHLAPPDRQAIREILAATKPGAPAGWAAP
jgi:hypothetical protein